MTFEFAINPASPPTVSRMVIGQVSYDRVSAGVASEDGVLDVTKRPSPVRAECAVTPHVLVVEDDADLLELIGAHMRRLGCSVSLAGNGYEAMQAAMIQVPDVAVIDIVLPDIDGRMIVGALRANELTSNCRIVVTSVLDPADISAASDAVLAKPFDRVDVDRVFRPLLAEFGVSD